MCFSVDLLILFVDADSKRIPPAIVSVSKKKKNNTNYYE